jgi:ankyrin repeat protein
MLIRAANEGRDQLVLDLLAAGAPANQVTGDLKYLDTPSALIAASLAGKVALVRALIAGGALTDAPYHASEAALMAAVKTPYPVVVAELLKTGLDVNAINDMGTNPLVSVGSKLPDKDEDEPHWRAASVETTRLLLAAKADPRSTDAHGDTALHHAWSAAAVDLLVQAGANLEARNEDGETPLLICLDDDAAMAMIKAGADIKAKDRLGNTVLQNATRAKLRETLAYLHEHGLR